MQAGSVSIACAVRQQRPDWLEQAILSAFAQTRPAKELILVSPPGDPCEEVVKRMRKVTGDDWLKLLHSEPGHPETYLQVAQGMRACTGDYITTFGSDDFFLPFKNAVEAPVLDAGAAVVFTDFFYSDPNLTPLGRYGIPSFDVADLERRCCIPECSMIRRSVWEEAGWLDPAVGHAGFWDAFLHMSELYPRDIVFKRIPTLLYRRHPGQLSQVENITPVGKDERRAALRKHYVRIGDPDHVINLDVVKIDTKEDGSV